MKALIIVLVLTSAVCADEIIWTNMKPGFAEGFSFSTGGVFFDDPSTHARVFETPDTPYLLELVELPFKPSSDVTVTVSLYGDVLPYPLLGGPGAVLESTTTFTQVAAAAVGFDFSGTTVLKPNSRYWIAVNPTGGSIFWRAAVPDAPNAFGPNADMNLSTPWTIGAGFAHAMRVRGTPVPVSEPPSIALLLGAALVVCRRLRLRTQ